MLMTCDHSSSPQLLHHWLGNIRAANISYFVIAAADDATSAALVQQGLEGHCYRLSGTHDRTQSSGYLWSSDSWNDATWRKVPAAQELLLLGYNVIMSDIDVMWLKDPLPYFNIQAAQADFVISLDAHYTDKPAGDDGLEPGSLLGRLMNTGVYFARARIQVLDLYHRWLAHRAVGNHDQLAFKMMITAVNTVEPLEDSNGTVSKRLGKVLGEKVVLGHLPLSSFLHSYSFSVMQLHKLMNTTPYEVHMVFGYGHQDSKVYKLRDAGLGWDDASSDYYKPAGGIISFDLVLPPVPMEFNSWASADDPMHSEEDMQLVHIKAIDFQLQQLYHALGVALALNRTLIMPHMLCFCVKGWFPNVKCRLPGDERSLLPFSCPGDQVFNIEALANPNVTVGGSLLRVRPPHFAEDVRLPREQQANRDGRTIVTPGQPKDVKKSPTTADGHAFALRPWGSAQRLCARRVTTPAEGDKVNTFFC
eukprot:gene6248-6484_t